MVFIPFQSQRTPTLLVESMQESNVSTYWDGKLSDKEAWWKFGSKFTEGKLVEHASKFNPHTTIHFFQDFSPSIDN